MHLGFALSAVIWLVVIGLALAFFGPLIFIFALLCMVVGLTTLLWLPLVLVRLFGRKP